MHPQTLLHRAVSRLFPRSEGNAAFKERDYDLAVKRYSEAIDLYDGDHTFFSNRAMALLALDRNSEAEADGRRCMEINPGFMKGFHRTASALIKLGRPDEAVSVCERGLTTHKGNADLASLLDEARTAAASAAAAAKSGMSKAELLKTAGNDLFKAARFEDAIPKYTEAINACDSLSSKVAVAILNNRAACNQQISNYGAVVDDTTLVLEAQPRNLKALLRRALAFEGLERYRACLNDVRQVLMLDPSHPVANKLQHRVGQTVRTLKAERPTH